MNRSKRPPTRRSVLLAAVCGFPAAAALAIDNPDAPDVVAQFQARAEAHEARIAAAGTSSEAAAADAAYERFLDAELNQAYGALQAKLDDPLRAALAQSQRRWLAFRDTEFRFIERNWTPARFGSSSALSRGAYRSALVKDRTVALLQYLKNYP